MIEGYRKKNGDKELYNFNSIDDTDIVAFE